jgi:histidine triad (HIT) family protein
MATLMTDKLGAEGFNLAQNNNEIAGQSVFHFHMHLIPRYSDDNQHFVMKPYGATDEDLDKTLKIITE